MLQCVCVRGNVVWKLVFVVMLLLIWRAFYFPCLKGARVSECVYVCVFVWGSFAFSRFFIDIIFEGFCVRFLPCMHVDVFKRSDDVIFSVSLLYFAHSASHFPRSPVHNEEIWRRRQKKKKRLKDQSTQNDLANVIVLHIHSIVIAISLTLSRRNGFMYLSAHKKIQSKRS